MAFSGWFLDMDIYEMVWCIRDGCLRKKSRFLLANVFDDYLQTGESFVRSGMGPEIGEI